MTTRKDAAAPAARKLYATRDFKDEGTGQSFAKGNPFPDDVEPGALENYEAAGLAGDKPKTETKAD